MSWRTRAKVLKAPLLFAINNNNTTRMLQMKPSVAFRAGLLLMGICVIAAWNLKSLTGEYRTERDKDTTQQNDEKKYLQFDDWLEGKFAAKSFFPAWVSDSEYAYRRNDGAIIRKNISSSDETVFLASSAWMSLQNPSDFFVSADTLYIAIVYQTNDGYAHYARTFSIAVFETVSSKLVVTTDFPDDKIQKVKWDPIGHKMAYVHDFDIYIVSDFDLSPIRVTDDGKENVLFNGISDWNHWGEITPDDALLWWSTDGTHLAYAKLDQTEVENFEFATYGRDKIYPTIISYPYPKPGTPTTKVSTFVFNADEMGIGGVEVIPSLEVKIWGDYELNSAVWRNDTLFTPTWKNRFDNVSISETCVDNRKNWTCYHVSEMFESADTGWLGHYKPANLVTMQNTSEYMTVLSNADGFPHIVVVNTMDNTRNWRTNGQFEVTDWVLGYSSIYLYDSINDWAYFTSTEYGNDGQGLPRVRHMWRVRAHGSNKTRECITCELNVLYEDRCNWVRSSFSPGGSYVVINCGGTGNGAPVSTLHHITGSGDVSLLDVLENNDELLQNMKAYYIREREYGTLKLPSEEDDYFYALHKPPNFNPSKKYPLLVKVYSGPGWQQTEDSYSFDWSRGYIASSDLDIVVMTFDGRGTGFRGNKIMHMVHRRLGEYEPLDQIEATKQIADSFKFIDKDRIAIWGRSYGGYITSRVMAEDDNQVFKCGIAVAPVTDWRTYSTLYTERYMGLPINDNEEGYNKSSAIQKLENYGKHYFVLIHGTSDENVHFLHSARLSKALIEKDVDFGAYFAGDEAHQFNKGVNAYGHHYKLLTHHLKICFGL